LNGTHKLLPYVGDVNTVGENIDTVKKNTEDLLGAGKEVGLEVNPEKTKYMLMSRRQNIAQNPSIKIANRSFEGVVEFKYLGTTLTDQNYMQEEIKSRLNSGNACYHLGQSLLSSRLLSRNLKVKMYKIIILPVVLYNGEFHDLYSSPDIISQFKSSRMRWDGHAAHVGEGRSVYMFLVGMPEGKRPLERPRRRWKYGVKMELRKIDWVCVEWVNLVQDRDCW
jgi:hypothetical protein